MAGNTPRIGPHSNRLRLKKVDGRTSAGRYVRQIERELIDHCGGPDRISVAQRVLCERTAIDLLRLKLADAALADGTASDSLLRIAHALRGTVRLALRDLPAMAGQPKPAASLDELVRDVQRRGRAAVA